MDTKFPVEDFATSPGETLHDSIQALGMSRHELAERTGLDKKSITQIIKGIEPISQHTASALETVLFFHRNEMSKSTQTVQDKVLSRIYGKGRGWVFTPNHFLDLGTRKATGTSP